MTTLRRWFRWLDGLFTQTLDEEAQVECPNSPCKEHRYEWHTTKRLPGDKTITLDGPPLYGYFIPESAIEGELKSTLTCHYCPKTIGPESKKEE